MTPTPNPVPPPRSRRRIRILAGLAVAGAIALGVLLVIGWRPWSGLPGPGAPPGAGDTIQLPIPTDLLPGEPSPAPEAILVGAGDIATCGGQGDEATAALLDDLDGTVFAAGDLAYELGRALDFARCYEPSWGRVRDRTLAAPGNHDWLTEDLAGYLGYFGDAATNEAGDPWYSIELGSWHVIVLDSDCGKVDGCDPASPQGRWLAADLAASDAACTAAIWHHPRFSSGQHGNSEAVAPLWEALAADGADIVIAAHDHDYERFAPLLPDGTRDDASGIRPFVVGTGGAPLRGFDRIEPHSQVRLSTTHGVLELGLRDGAYGWRFIAVDGTVLDAGEGACH